MRIKGGQVVLYDELHPSFTEPRAGGALHKYVRVPLCGVLDVFLQRTSEAIARQGERFFLPDEEARDDCLYLSAIPWLCFTGLTHAENLDRDDAVPRISWGRWFWLGERLLLPFSVQAHHALVDGVHLGKFIDALQKKLDAF